MVFVRARLLVCVSRLPPKLRRLANVARCDWFTFVSRNDCLCFIGVVVVVVVMLLLVGLGWFGSTSRLHSVSLMIIFETLEHALGEPTAQKGDALLGVAALALATKLIGALFFYEVCLFVHPLFLLNKTIVGVSFVLLFVFFYFNEK